ncbi:hypothetical protein E2562_021782 [Oryza meyeriana var. granulata]|uniref:Uncharacterized protein n=1 Tax=Oryza meyeriana var. granulata TaxID=110450 RepID=A0A6G1EN65_9ORYZ|nr:hypothetical protein E2562_021782 [Oryza meyeriana var. granulata]
MVAVLARWVEERDGAAEGWDRTMMAVDYSGAAECKRDTAEKIFLGLEIFFSERLVLEHVMCVLSGASGEDDSVRPDALVRMERHRLTGRPEGERVSGGVHANGRHMDGCGAWA